MADPAGPRIPPTVTHLAGSQETRDRFMKLLGELLGLLGQPNLPGGPVFCADNMLLFTRNASFLEDRRLLQAVQDNMRDPLEPALIWRTHILCWAAGMALTQPGDLVECGTYRGYTAAVLAQYHDLTARPDRRFYLFDTFDPGDGGGEGQRLPHHSERLYDEVRDRFRQLPNVLPVRGRVPEIFARTCPERICFVHADLNDAAAERGALEALWDRLVPRGVIVFDDYGWNHYRASRDAIRDFVSGRGQQIVELPTGQGMVIKT